MTDRVEWRAAEWDADASMAHVDGYVLSVEPDEGGWFWRVDVTAERSEFPEVYDAGEATSLGVARARAEEALRHAWHGA
jgi:hypothetical protein